MAKRKKMRLLALQVAKEVHQILEQKLAARARHCQHCHELMSGDGKWMYSSFHEETDSIDERGPYCEKCVRLDDNRFKPPIQHD